jgi:hypothetical protein
VPAAPLWIQAVMNGEDRMAAVKAVLQQGGSAVCGKTLRPREVAFKCLSCASDPTCIMCTECFQRSPCRNHDYRMIHSAAGMCDCGDPSAWKPEGFCTAHQGLSDEHILDKVPEEMRAWITECLQAAIRFAVRCSHTAITEASPSEQAAGSEKLVVAADRALTMLKDFAGVSDASRRLVAEAFAGAAVVSDVPDIPQPPKGAIGSVDDDTDSMALSGEEGPDFDNASSTSDDQEEDTDDEATTGARPHHHHHDKHGHHASTAASLLEHMSASGPLGIQAADESVFEESVADRMAAEHVHRAAHRFSLMDQVFLLDMVPPPKSAAALITGLKNLLSAIGIDTAFRRLYLRSFAATAWHSALSARARATSKSNLVYLKSGAIEQLSVQVLTVGPLVDEALLPASKNAPTIVSALLGSQLIGLAKRGRRVLCRDTDFIVERRNLRRRFNFSTLYHMRYVSFTSLTPKVILAHRHLFRAYCILAGARQASDYYIERTTERRNLDCDLWDVDAVDVSVAWILHDTLKTACEHVTALDGSGLAAETAHEALQLPAALYRPDAALAPPVEMTVPGFARLVLRCFAKPVMPPSDRGPKTKFEQLPPWLQTIKRCFESLFEDLGETLMDVTQCRRHKSELQVELTVTLQGPPAMANATPQATGQYSDDMAEASDSTAAFMAVLSRTVGGEGAERRISVPRFNTLQPETPFTFHTALSRLAALLAHSVSHGCVGIINASDSNEDKATASNLLLRVLVAEALAGPAEQTIESEHLIPSLIDAAVTPFLVTGQYVDQLWRTDYCGMHKHVNVYHTFLCGHNQELDLFMLQLLSATYGASYVATQLLLRFGYHQNTEGTTGAKRGRATPIPEIAFGHWHLLRLFITIATDDCKTSMRSDSRSRIVHNLARRMMKRSDMDRYVLTFESDDDQKQLARARSIDAVLKEVAVAEKRKEGNVYRLKPEAWELVNPYYVGWTPYDLDNATEAHELQTKSHYAKLGQEAGKPVKQPRRPAMVTVPEHVPMFSRVDEILHTVAFFSVVLEPLLLRAALAHLPPKPKQPEVPKKKSPKSPKSPKDAVSEDDNGLPKPTSTHLITAIDALVASVSAAKRIPGCAAKGEGARGVRWSVYESAVSQWRSTAAWSAPQISPKLLRMLPVDTSASHGFLHVAFKDVPYHTLHLNTTNVALPVRMTGLEAIKTLLEKADTLLEDVPAHYQSLLHGIVEDLETEVNDNEGPLGAAGGVEGEFAGSGSGSRSTMKFVDPEEAALKKKAALKNRQAALMAKLRKRQATSIASAEETHNKSNAESKDPANESASPTTPGMQRGPGSRFLATGTDTDDDRAMASPAGSMAMSTGSMSMYDQTMNLHLGDCVAAFETLECLCAFCNEPGSGSKPLAFLGQTSSSNVLAELQSLAQHQTAVVQSVESDDVAVAPPAEAGTAAAAASASATSIKSSSLGTAHMNFCGHMAHQECFERRVGHLGNLRDRVRDVGNDLQAFLRGLHFKGMKYLAKNESLCPICSRAVSTLCPAASAHHPPRGSLSMNFVRALARSALRVPIGADIDDEALAAVRALAFSNGDDDANAASLAAGAALVGKAKDKERLLLTTLVALRSAAQQTTLFAIAASAGRGTTVRSFAALHALVRVVMRAIHSACSHDRDSMEALVRFVNGSVSSGQPHALAMAGLAAFSFSESYPELEKLWRAARHSHSITASALVMNADDDGSALGQQQAVFDQRDHIRTAALIKMLATHQPLSQQEQVLAEAASVDELVDKINFSGFDAPASSSDTADAELQRLLGLVSYVAIGKQGLLGDATANDEEDQSLVPLRFALHVSSPVYPPSPLKGSGGDIYPAALQLRYLSRLITRHMSQRFTAMVETSLSARCTACGKKNGSYVLCLGCGQHYCAKGDPPELSTHALQCGRGTSIFLELGTSRLVIVQAVNKRASVVAPVHVDHYLEPDVGLRRGMPLHLADDRVADLVLPWILCAWDHQTHVLHTDTWRTEDKSI